MRAFLQIELAKGRVTLTTLGEFDSNSRTFHFILPLLQGFDLVQNRSTLPSTALIFLLNSYH
jgi:hypothetical protein